MIPTIFHNPNVIFKSASNARNHFAGFGLGMAQICFTIPGELMPSKHRSFGLGLLNFFHGFIIFTSLQAKAYIEIYLGMDALFIITAICTAASIALVLKFVPETRGKSLAEIEDHYKQFVTEKTNDD